VQLCITTCLLCVFLEKLYHALHYIVFLQRFSLIIVVCLIAGGLFLFVYESSQFDLEGFILVLTASFLGGIRWTLSQILAQKKELGKWWTNVLCFLPFVFTSSFVDTHT